MSLANVPLLPRVGQRQADAAVRDIVDIQQRQDEPSQGAAMRAGQARRASGTGHRSRFRDDNEGVTPSGYLLAALPR